MLRFVGRRVIIMFITLFIIVSVTWLMSKALPGTPFADEKLTPSPGAALREVRSGRAAARPVREVHAQRGAGRPGQLLLLREPARHPDDLGAGSDLGLYRRAGGHIRADTGSRAGRPGGPAAQRHPGLRGHDGGGGWASPCRASCSAPILQYWFGFKWEMLPIA